MNRLQKSRVTVDFFTHERDALQMLCEQDIRPPQEQLRWLVLAEAARRGTQKNTSASVCQDSRAGVVESINQF